MGGCQRRPKPELTGQRSFRPLQSVPPPSSLTILGRRLELEAYSHGALYVGLGGEKGSDWMVANRRSSSQNGSGSSSLQFSPQGPESPYLYAGTQGFPPCPLPATLSRGTVRHPQSSWLRAWHAAGPTDAPTVSPVAAWCCLMPPAWGVSPCAPMKPHDGQWTAGRRHVRGQGLGVSLESTNRRPYDT
jgi:hypothetical protein